MRYKPFEIILTPEASLDVFGEAPRENPPRRSKPYKGLRVTVALVRDSGYKAKEAPSVSSPRDAFELLKHLADDPQENFVVLIVNAAGRCTGICEVHRGTLGSVNVHPADVLRPVLVAGAPSFIVAHNHPSGHSEPSADDIALTRRLKEAAKLLGLNLLDHVVIGDGGFTALSERGAM